MSVGNEKSFGPIQALLPKHSLPVFWVVALFIACAQSLLLLATTAMSPPFPAICHHDGGNFVVMIADRSNSFSGELAAVDLRTRVVSKTRLEGPCLGRVIVDGDRLFYSTISGLNRIDIPSMKGIRIAPGGIGLADTFFFKGTLFLLGYQDGKRGIFKIGPQGEFLEAASIPASGNYVRGAVVPDGILLMYLQERGIGGEYYLFHPEEGTAVRLQGKLLAIPDCGLELWEDRIIAKGPKGEVAFPICSPPLNYFRVYGNSVVLATAKEVIISSGQRTIFNDLDTSDPSAEKVFLSPLGAVLFGPDGSVKLWTNAGQFESLRE